METKLEQLNSKLTEVSEKLNSLNSAMYAEITIIRNKYQQELDSLTAQEKELSADIKNEKDAVKNNKINQAWEEAQAKNEINEFYLASMLEKLGIERCHLLGFTKKKSLKNGINIWLVSSRADYANEYKLYLAFKGAELVGTSYRDIAKHAGDATTPFSFIGQFDELLMAKKTSENYPEGWSVNATFTEWSKKLGELKEDEIPVMVMTEETLTELKDGINNYWSEYGWKYNKLKK